MRENPDQSIATFSGVRLDTKNAWALYARRRWPENTVNHVAAEWELTDAKARGVVFAQASQSTIDDILDHPRGGFGLGLLILEIRMQTRLRAWVQSEQERLADEAERTAAEAAALAAMAARLPDALGAGLGLDGGGGVRVAAEPRSFRRKSSGLLGA